jgi:hypothetical protein
MLESELDSGAQIKRRGAVKMTFYHAPLSESDLDLSFLQCNVS